MLIRQVHIKGFKSIVDQTMELGRINCLIGANGVGKSNILEAIGILSAAANGRVDDEAIVRRGVRAGLPRLYKSSFSRSPIPPAIDLAASGPTATDTEFHVTLLNPLEGPKPAWAYKTETFREKKEYYVSRGVPGKEENLAKTFGKAALKMVDLPADGKASIFLRALQSYAIFSPSTPALRSTIPDSQMRVPVGLSGGGLAEGFVGIRKTCREEILENILELIDWVEEVSASEAAGSLLSPAVPRSKNVLKFTDRFMATNRNTLTAYDASEGALYILFTAVLCLSNDSPDLFAIDNLDQALNPRLAARLVGRLHGWLQEGGPNRQMLFTAHNPAVLDGLDLSNPEIRLFAVERNNLGHTTIRPITVTPELQRLQAEYPLSRLWLMGHLGAVPNV